jgi:hypothetical protein
LDNEEIFFTRSDKFEDRFEGTYPKANIKMRPQRYQNIIKQEYQEKVFRTIDEFAKYMRRLMVINCWHMNEYESAAMWGLYLKSGEGIAIQSNIGRLIDSFADSPQKISIGRVIYKDFNKECIDELDQVNLFIHKRKSFEHEREIRAMHQFPVALDKEGNVDFNGESPVEYGIGISCDIRILIEKVYISPSSPPWFEELVRSMCEKFKLKVDVIKSELSEVPY